jgi:hypothetical protein
VNNKGQAVEKQRGGNFMRSSIKTKKWHVLILLLAMIGLIKQAVESPLSILLPLLIAGLLYYLYRFPPRWLFKLSSASHPTSPYKKGNKRGQLSSKKGRKKAFRVIEGKK